MRIFLILFFSLFLSACTGLPEGITAVSDFEMNNIIDKIQEIYNKSNKNKFSKIISCLYTNVEALKNIETDISLNFDIENIQDYYMEALEFTNNIHYLETDQQLEIFLFLMDLYVKRILDILNIENFNEVSTENKNNILKVLMKEFLYVIKSVENDNHKYINEIKQSFNKYIDQLKPHSTFDVNEINTMNNIIKNTNELIDDKDDIPEDIEILKPVTGQILNMVNLDDMKENIIDNLDKTVRLIQEGKTEIDVNVKKRGIIRKIINYFKNLKLDPSQKEKLREIQEINESIIKEEIDKIEVTLDNKCGDIFKKIENLESEFNEKYIGNLNEKLNIIRNDINEIVKNFNEYKNNPDLQLSINVCSNRLITNINEKLKRVKPMSKLHIILEKYFAEFSHMLYEYLPKDQINKQTQNEIYKDKIQHLVNIYEMLIDNFTDTMFNKELIEEEKNTQIKDILKLLESIMTELLELLESIKDNQSLRSILQNHVNNIILEMEKISETPHNFNIKYKSKIHSDLNYIFSKYVDKFKEIQEYLKTKPKRSLLSKLKFWQKGGATNYNELQQLNKYIKTEFYDILEVLDIDNLKDITNEFINILQSPNAYPLLFKQELADILNSLTDILKLKINNKNTLYLTIQKQLGESDQFLKKYF